MVGEKRNAYERAQYRKNLAKHPRKFRKKINARARKWQRANRAYYKLYRAERKEKYREYIKIYMREWRKKHPKKTKKHRLNNYRKNPTVFYAGAAKRRALKKGANGGNHRYSEWLNLLAIHKFACFYCKRALTIKNATRDHRVPLSRGGSDLIDNIAPACRRCNCAKGIQTAEEYFLKLSTTTSKCCQQEATSS